MSSAISILKFLRTLENCEELIWRVLENFPPTYLAQQCTRSVCQFFVVLGTNAEGLELQHWKEAMTSKKPIAQWHSLREYHPADQTIHGVISPTHKSVISKRKIARFFATSSEDEG